MSVSAELVKKLREISGAPMLECKKALEEAGGDQEKAFTVLRKRGQAAAAKKAGRVTSEGVVGSYIHAGGKMGVLIEVNCESDFVARNEEFQQLVHDLAMQVCATDPRFIRKEDVTEEVLQREKEILKEQAAASGKPEAVLDQHRGGQAGEILRGSLPVRTTLHQGYHRRHDHRRVDRLQDRQVRREYHGAPVRAFQGG